MDDTDESNFEGDDITASCNVLELCNDTFDIEKVWVRVSIHDG